MDDESDSTESELGPPPPPAGVATAADDGGRDEEVGRVVAALLAPGQWLASALGARATARRP